MSTPRVTQYGEGKYCVLKVPLTGENMVHLNMFPGYNKWDGRDFIFRPTDANIAHLAKHWPDAEWDPAVQPHMAAWLDRQAQADVIKNARLTTLNDLEDKSLYEQKTLPYRHQMQAFLLSRTLPNFALLMEQGTGKTKVTLDTAAYLYMQAQITTLVVIAVNGVHREWVETEIPKHLPDFANPQCYVHTAHDTKIQQRAYDAMFNHKAGLRIATFNVEGLTPACCNLITRLLTSGPAMLVVDESSRIKTPSAIRTKAVTALGVLAPYKRILTGTPITQGVEDLYSQFKFLSPDILGFDTYTTFKRHYCITKKIDFGRAQAEKIIGYQNIDELKDRLAGYSFRVLKSECLDLPSKIYMTRTYDLTPYQRRVYNQLKNEFLTELEDGRIVTEAHALTRLLRLQQIVCNWLDGAALEEHNPRIQTLKDVLDELPAPGKAIIWCRFKEDFNAIRKALPKDELVEYHGGVTEEDRQIALREFRDPASKKRWMLANAQSAGLGLNLTVATLEVYYSNTFNLEQRLQSEDRAHRIGQTEHLTIVDIEARNTVDRKIVRALQGKYDIARMVLEDPADFFATPDTEQ